MAKPCPCFNAHLILLHGKSIVYDYSNIYPHNGNLMKNSSLQRSTNNVACACRVDLAAMKETRTVLVFKLQATSNWSDLVSLIMPDYKFQNGGIFAMIWVGPPRGLLEL